MISSVDDLPLADALETGAMATVELVQFAR